MISKFKLFTLLVVYLSILKSVEEIHLRLYQSHKDPKFPAASGHSLCSRQIQIVVYLTIPCKLLSANTLQYFMAFKTLLDVVWALQQFLYLNICCSLGFAVSRYVYIIQKWYIVNASAFIYVIDT